MLVQNRFAELLAAKARREGRMITHDEVSQETGLSTTTISKWAHNRVARFDASTIDTLCDYLGCGLSDLLVRTKDEAHPEFGQEILAAAAA